MNKDIKVSLTCFEEDGENKVAYKVGEGCNNKHLYNLLSALMNTIAQIHKNRGDKAEDHTEVINYYRNCSVDLFFGNNTLGVEQPKSKNWSNVINEVEDSLKKKDFK